MSTRSPKPKPKSQTKVTLTPEEQYVVFAALVAMVDDVHSVQDMMKPEQWTLAEKVCKRLEKIINDRES